jgi:hypothetical protein
MPASQTQPPAPTVPDDSGVQVRADRCVTKRLGEWTTSSRFDVSATSGVVVLDFLLPRIDAERIDVRLDIDHGLVTLLVSEGTRVEQDGLRWIGPGHLRDWSGAPSPDGLTVHLEGEVRWGDVRVRRGGVAILSLLKHGQVGAVRHSYRGGKLAGRGR